ncbi:MAG: SUMF1/EgtB/PvdO family nonheme iron enzyme [Verrucomicrobiaceae bacterium]|nr:SUMF1/EgtB/PvdO family nonheme iron enzyme [Verrucomicrobiaceae bacterium]
MKTAFLFLSLILFSASALLHAAERRALVIGNKDYTETGTFADLDTTLNDATVMRTLLGKAGFKLAPAAENLTRIAMMDALIDFRDSLQEGDEAVVYFAGHGLEYQKNVYLMGTNAEGRLKAQLEAEGISEATISATLAEKNIKLAILLLDCCREIPDASWLSADPSTRSRRGGGAAAVTPPPNVIVGYATSGGRFTNDALSNADRNGPLVAALKNHWDSGEVFELMWKDVAADVFTASQAAVKAGTAGEIQMPSIYGQTVHRFSFMPKGETPPAQVAKMVPTPPPAVIPETTGRMPAIPSGATKDAPHVNGLGMKFIPLPGTSVLMCQHETRVADFAEFIRSDKSFRYSNGEDPYVLDTDGWKQRPGNSWDKPGFTQSDQHPVTCVSWQDALAFCDWLSTREGSIYRLPTDHEWSIAVGIGDKEDPDASPYSKDVKIKGAFPWGSGYPPHNGAGNYAGSEAKTSAWPSHYETISGYRDEHSRTAPVMTYKCNTNSFYDLGGNLLEWCSDWCSSEQESRVLRGASWRFASEAGVLSSNREVGEPYLRRADFGFRCVLVVSGR